MTDETSTAVAESHGAHGEHEEIHLPPNSWVPLSLALALTMTFVGFLSNPVVWIVGLVWVVGTLVQWFRAARTEYGELH